MKLSRKRSSRTSKEIIRPILCKSVYLYIRGMFDPTEEQVYSGQKAEEKKIRKTMTLSVIRRKIFLICTFAFEIAAFRATANHSWLLLLNMWNPQRLPSRGSRGLLSPGARWEERRGCHWHLSLGVLLQGHGVNPADLLLFPPQKMHPEILFVTIDCSGLIHDT